MPKNTSQAPMSPGTLRAIAGTLKHYADRYEQLAVAFESVSVESLEVSNADGLKMGMDKIARHLAATNHALDRHVGESIVPLIERSTVHKREDATPEPLIVAEKRRKYT